MALIGYAQVSAKDQTVDALRKRWEAAALCFRPNASESHLSEPQETK